MSKKQSWIIVTDLDASLLDAHYSYEAASEAIDYLQEKEIPIVLNSSKTIHELIALANRWNWNPKPFLVGENGACLGIPMDHQAIQFISVNHTHQGYACSYDPNAYERIISLARLLRNTENYQFKGFSDLSVSELCTLTGLSEQDAELARHRYCTEPILWNDSKEAFNNFLESLSKAGIRVIRGGQFIHLMEINYDKSTGMDAILGIFKTMHPNIQWETLAIGDSENDIPMLERADCALIIPNQSNGTIALERSDFYLARDYASTGWNTELLNILNSNP